MGGAPAAAAARRLLAALLAFLPPLPAAAAAVGGCAFFSGFSGSAICGWQAGRQEEEGRKKEGRMRRVDKHTTHQNTTELAAETETPLVSAVN
jgi:hypothetical protein